MVSYKSGQRQPTCGGSFLRTWMTLTSTQLGAAAVDVLINSRKPKSCIRVVTEQLDDVSQKLASDVLAY